ncbi:hypothetical protein B0O99DRAFT_238889 [Bisporella sp. PMI_857]|nr:hypothetical protein B0O99DRAFT_238889 [Bisporella sp. PMI_857]
MFCCLPGQYGYWYKSLGQDSVGMCSKSSILPENSTPAVQFNNGDGSVSPDGVQLEALPTATPTPAPTCDIIHYGWSLQVNDEGGCTEGSKLCPYGGSCCPSGLNCGTVIGDSEVPVCCVPGNPDCRGDVEGLWPQLCADSSWALWHVNTNGNHFCCLPGQIGYNIPNDNAAVGFCGSAVPNGTMRSILDYEGDGSTPGSFLKFPCDTSPAPNASFESITKEILNPPATLNPYSPTRLPLATGLYPNATMSYNAVATVVKPWLQTTYVCPPGSSETLQVVHILSSGIPVTKTRTLGGYESTAKAGGVDTLPTAIPAENTHGIATSSGIEILSTSPTPIIFTGSSIKSSTHWASWTLGVVMVVTFASLC